MADSLYLQIAEKIKHNIRQKGIAPGALLPSERRLAEQYHVSRSVIRQALSKLSEEKIIDILPKRGALVSFSFDKSIVEGIRQNLRLNQQELLNALEIREMLELTIVQKCLPYVTAKDISDLETIWDTMDYYRMEKRVEPFLQGDALFHERIAQILPNSLFLTLIQSTFIETPEMFDVTRAVETAFDDAQAEHRKFIDSLKARDINGLNEAVREEMDGIRRDIYALP